MSQPKNPIPALEAPLKKELEEDAVAAKAATLSGLRSLVAGGVGGICAVAVGHPFDLVKVRLQTAERGIYTGAIDVVRRTVAREGLARGLYAGVSAPLVGVTPICRQLLGAYKPSPAALGGHAADSALPQGYDVGKGLVRRFSAVQDNQFTIAQISAAGFFSAIPMTVITAPFERVKVLLQIQGQRELKAGEKPKYSGGVDVVRQLYREGGVRSVFRGSVATLARDGPGSAAYFAAYEYIKRRLTPKDADGNPGPLSLTAVMIAGGSAGVAMWVPIFPIDTIKSRLQSAPGKPSIKGVVSELYARNGLRAFFPGIGPALARAVPANAATL
ncbi:MAG: carnitine transporter [Trizodia sp. TS-e1964]|nr:MAG: carnitine transporter [Trizodia sp. TS-e1964]